jgi:ABC-2 type transport system permease protein
MVDGITEIISDSPFGSLIAFTAIVFLLMMFIYFMTHTFSIALIIGICLEAVLCVLYRMDTAAFSGSFSAALKSIAFYNYLRNFVYNGIFDLTAIVFYLSVIFLFLFFSVQSLEMRRWN